MSGVERISPEARRAGEIEAAFLAGVESNLNQARSTRLRGTHWDWTTRSQEDHLRRLMADRRQHDRDLLRALPRNAGRVLTGRVRRLFFGKRVTSVAMASTLSPLEHYLDEGGPAPPVGLARLMAHLREQVADMKVEHLIGVCSPSGFTDEVRAARVDLPNVTLVLVEPGDDGGWRVLPGSSKATPADCRLFDPEATAHKVDRVLEEIERSSVELLTGGLNAAELAARIGVSAEVAMMAFERATRKDRELRVSRKRGEVMLYRGAATNLEEPGMSMIDRLRQLFGGEGNEARKINALSERRARLAGRRDRVYADISKLETREADLLRQGREASSPTVKRRLATQIKQVRDDIDRLGTSARVVGQQVEVISTHIHNLTLIQQGKVARLPTTEELTGDAVRAEEMIEQLSADVELAGSLAMSAAESSLSEDELAILAELDAPQQDEATAGRERESGAAERVVEEPDPQRRRSREPEAG